MRVCVLVFYIYPTGGFGEPQLFRFSDSLIGIAAALIVSEQVEKETNKKRNTCVAVLRPKRKNEQNIDKKQPNARAQHVWECERECVQIIHLGK